MYSDEFTFSSFWWIVPLVMMLMCFFMMRTRRGFWMCGLGSRNEKGDQADKSTTAKEILDKRYASGAIGRDEYEEIKKTIADSTDTVNR